MNEHIEDILVGGRPMTKLEIANKEVEEIFTKRGFTNIKQMATMFDWYKEEKERLNYIITEIKKAFNDDNIHNNMELVRKNKRTYKTKGGLNVIEERNSKAINYINEVWNTFDLPMGTKIIIRTIDRLLQGSDKE